MARRMGGMERRMGMGGEWEGEWMDRRMGMEGELMDIPIDTYYMEINRTEIKRAEIKAGGQ